MNTEENNKMIAEFMGARPIVFSGGTKGHTFWNDDFDGEGRYGAFPDGATNYFEYDKGYHTSWDWLMPVLNKIRSFDCEFDIEQIGVFEVSYGGNWIGKSISHYEFDLDLTYNAVVEFIKQHNEGTD